MALEKKSTEKKSLKDYPFGEWTLLTRSANRIDFVSIGWDRPGIATRYSVPVWASNNYGVLIVLNLSVNLTNGCSFMKYAIKLGYCRLREVTTVYGRSLSDFIRVASLNLFNVCTKCRYNINRFVQKTVTLPA